MRLYWVGSCIIFRHLKASTACNSQVNSPNWLQFKLIQGFMHVVITRKFDEDPSKPIGKKFQQRQFPKRIVQSIGNSNLSEILCMSRLSAILIKIRLKRNGLYSGHGKISFTEFKSKKLKRNLTDLAGIWHCHRSLFIYLFYFFYFFFFLFIFFFFFFLPVLVTSTFDTDTNKSKDTIIHTLHISLCFLAYQIKISYAFTWSRI